MFGRKKKNKEQAPMVSLDALDTDDTADTPAPNPGAETEPGRPEGASADEHKDVPEADPLEVRETIEIPTLGMLISEDGGQNTHTVVPLTDKSEYETVLREMYLLDPDAPTFSSKTLISLKDTGDLTTFDSVKYLDFTMMHMPMTADFITDAMFRRSALLDAYFSNIDRIAGNAVYHASIIELEREQYVNLFEFHLVFNGKLSDETFDTMIELFYNTLEIHGYMTLDVDAESDAIKAESDAPASEVAVPETGQTEDDIKKE